MQSTNAAFAITTDSLSDLSADYLQQHSIAVISLSYTVGGKVYDFYQELPHQQFYGQMREGVPSSTQHFSPMDAERAFERIFDETLGDILHISSSGPLSACYENVCIAAHVVMMRHPGRRIICFDSRSISLGQGILVATAVESRDEHHDIDTTHANLELLRSHTCHLMSVDDVEYLYQSGRLTKRQAALNIMLDIRPIVQINHDGNMVMSNGVRSRRRSLIALLDIMEQRLQYGWAEKNRVIYIAHADAEQDARFLASRIETRFGFKHFLISPMGAIVGVHGGPGVVGVFFLGNHKL